MTETVFTVGDTLKALSGTVTDGGQPVNLTAATSVEVHVQKPRNEGVISRAAVMVDAATGKWSMPWQVGDLTSIGNYYVEVQVTWPGGVQTFGRSTFRVQGQIA